MDGMRPRALRPLALALLLGGATVCVDVERRQGAYVIDEHGRLVHAVDPVAQLEADERERNRSAARTRDRDRLRGGEYREERAAREERIERGGGRR